MQLVRLAFGHNSLASDQTTLALSSPVPLQNYLWTLKNASQTFKYAYRDFEEIEVFCVVFSVLNEHVLCALWLFTQ